MKKNTVTISMKQGMLRLLSKKKLIDISVTDLIKESGVARASFYRVYTNIDQVVDDLVRDIHSEFMNESYPIILTKNEAEIKRLIINFLFRFKNNSDSVFNIMPENYLILSSKLEKISTQANSYNPDGTIYERYLPGLCLINILGVLKIWKKHGFKETPEELTDFIYEMIGKKYLEL